MGFELKIATKYEPATVDNRADHVPSRYTAVELNGVCDRSDVRGLLDTIDTIFLDGAETVLVDAYDVSTDDPECFSLFTNGLMAFRSSGRNVQMRVRDPAQHARLAALANSRDWLLAYDNAGTDGRRALHLDGVARAGDPRPEPG